VKDGTFSFSRCRNSQNKRWSQSRDNELRAPGQPSQTSIVLEDACIQLQSGPPQHSADPAKRPWLPGTQDPREEANQAEPQPGSWCRTANPTPTGAYPGTSAGAAVVCLGRRPRACAAPPWLREYRLIYVL